MLSTFRFRDCQALLHLQPVAGQEAKVTMTRPATSTVLEKVSSGTWAAHPTRLPLQKKWITNALSTIQRQLLLKPGATGDWTDEAQQRFEALLTNHILNKAPATLAIQDIQQGQSSASSSAPKAQG